jgi:hypothetical protein
MSMCPILRSDGALLLGEAKECPISYGVGCSVMTLVSPLSDHP